MKTQIISEKQCSIKLGISARTLQRMRLRGQGPRFVKISPRRIGYLEEEIQKWLETHSSS